MIRIKYSPQFSTQEKPTYRVRGQKVTAILADGRSDEFDFGPLNNPGKAEEILSSLPVPAVLAARKRPNGVLEVELWKPLTLHASMAERFPEWQEVDDGDY